MDPKNLQRLEAYAENFREGALSRLTEGTQTELAALITELREAYIVLKADAEAMREVLEDSLLIDSPPVEEMDRITKAFPGAYGAAMHAAAAAWARSGMSEGVFTVGHSRGTVKKVLSGDAGRRMLEEIRNAGLPGPSLEFDMPDYESRRRARDWLNSEAE